MKFIFRWNHYWVLCVIYSYGWENILWLISWSIKILTSFFLKQKWVLLYLLVICMHNFSSLDLTEHVNVVQYLRSWNLFKKHKGTTIFQEKSRKLHNLWIMCFFFNFQYLCYFLHKTRRRIFKSFGLAFTFLKMSVFRCNKVMIYRKYIRVKFFRFSSQPAFICSKLKMETPEYCVKPVKN